MGEIRRFAEHQDEALAGTRRVVKGLRQQVSMIDTTDADVRAFAVRVRDMCQKVLRRRYEMEGY